MSGKPSQLDLSQLAVDRDRSAPAKIGARRAWFSRYVLPAAILCGFVGLFAWAARDSLLPAQPITITPVVVSSAEIKQEGTPLFQAAGWVEPRPMPVVASSLAPGVIQDLLVIEGDVVTKGQPVATLIDTDARLSLAGAKSLHALQVAEVARAEAALQAATTNLEQPVVLRAALADADAMLAKTEQELNNLPFAIEGAKTQLVLAQENLKRKEQAGDAILGRILRETRAELASAENTVNELISREPTLRRQRESLQRKRDAIAAQLSLLTEEKRALAEAKANLAVAQAQAEKSQLAVDAAELLVERMTVRSPINGRVLSVAARPGQRLSGINPHSEQGSNAVASLYDPSMLQVRVDVRLEDVPQVQLGQPAQIETAALADPIAGQVISVTTQADIQKNTLQVKVAVIDPPEVIKPEMLAKVTFLAPPQLKPNDVEVSSPLRLFVPQSLVLASDGDARIWIADLTAGVAKMQPIKTSRGTTEDGLVEVISGLTPTDKLIVGGRESLADGVRVRVTGEDETLANSEYTPRAGQLVDETR